MYSVSTYFRLDLIEPSAREVFIFWSREKRGGASEERRREHCSNLARLETASEFKKLNSLADGYIIKINEHAVCIV